MMDRVVKTRRAIEFLRAASTERRRGRGGAGGEPLNLIEFEINQMSLRVLVLRLSSGKRRHFKS